jgi:hypothetical protein
LQDLGVHVTTFLQTDLAEVESEALNLIQVGMVESSVGLLFEHCNEPSSIMKGGTFSPSETIGRS